MRKINTHDLLGAGTLLLALAGCGSRNEVQSTQIDTITAAQPTSVEKVAPVVHTSVTISIEQMKFQPDNITVSSGDTVIFLNHDMVEHDVTEEKQQWKSKPLATNASWKLVPTKSGSYYCSIHPVMKGKITVQ